MSSKARLIVLAAASLTVLPMASAFAQVNVAHTPYPTREQKLVESFEGDVALCTEEQVINEECTVGWHGFSSATEVKPAVTVNNDPKFVAHGTQSLKVDMTDVERDWKGEYFRGVLAEPVDAAGFNTLAMNVYFTFDPDTGEIANSSWSQIFVRVQKVNADGSDAGEDWYSNRDFKRGWNYFTWDLNPIQEGQKISRIIVGGNAGNFWTAPLYFDNIHLIQPAFPGIKTDEVVVLGFDEQETADLAAARAENVPVTFYSQENAEAIAELGEEFNPDFVKDGSGSLRVDMTGLGLGWFNNWMQIGGIVSEVDLSKASAIHLDVYVPSDSVAGQDWWQIGFGVGGAPPEGGNGWAESSTTQLLTDRWNTLVIPLVTDPNVPVEAQDAYRLNNIGYLELRRNAGGEWVGPIYIDNLRVVVPATVPAGCKGDANSDGAVNVADAVAILQHAVNIGTPLTGQALLNAQVTAGDTDVNVADAVAVLQAIVGVAPGSTLIPNLNCP